MAHVTFKKPHKGEYLQQRKESRAARVAAEQKVMQDAKRRDSGKCRVPRCEFAKRGLPVDPAHMTHRGSGGNPSGDRTTRDQIWSLCRIHHSMFDRGDLDISPMTKTGADGPCAYYVRSDSGRMEHIATETLIGLSIPRGQ